MTFQDAFVGALALGVFVPSSDAFSLSKQGCFGVTISTRVSTISKIVTFSTSNLGWDNEDYMEALGSGQEALDKANEAYRAQSKFNPDDVYDPSNENDPRNADERPWEDTSGATLTDEMKAAVKASHTEDEERFQGGTMFKNLMAKAEEGQYNRPPPPPQQQAMNPDNLSVEEQARLFREMTQQQNQQAYQQPAHRTPMQNMPQQYPVGGQPVAADGRPVGRNKDADTIANTSDMYLAQLKVDSTSRNYARYRGDEEAANRVFEDPAIQDIIVPVNPYTEAEKKAQEEALLEQGGETVTYMPWLDNDKDKERMITDKSFAGVSYKDKLKQKKAKSAGGGSSSTTEPPPIASPPPPPPPPPAATATASASATAGGYKDKLKEAKAKPPAASTPPPPPPPPPVAPAQATTAPASAAPPATSSGDVGGDRVGSMLACLEGAIGMYRNATPELQGSFIVTLRAALVSAVDTCNEIIPTPAVPTSSSSSDDVISMLAVLDGAVLMYRNSPPELQPSVMVTLRAALMSAVATCDQIIAAS